MTAHLEPWDRALLAALDADERYRSLPDLAAESGAPPALLDGLVRAGLLTPRTGDAAGLFSRADEEAVRAGMELVGTGLPLAELLDLARRMHESLVPLAGEAVDMFVRFVRDAVAGAAEDEAEASDRILTAFTSALPATERLVSGHFRSLVLAAARRRLGADDD